MKPLSKAILGLSFFSLLLFGGLFYYTQTQFQLIIKTQQEQNTLLMQRITDVQKAGEENLEREKSALRKDIDSALGEIGKSIEKTREEAKKSVTELTGQLQGLEQESQQKIVKLEEQILNVNIKSGDFTGIVNKAIKSVVSVITDVGIGSGAIIDGDGYIITNRHVIEGAKKGSIKTSDGKMHAVRIVVKAQQADLALLKIEGTYPSLRFGKSPAVGSRIIAMGSPAGLDFTVTEGIVSAQRLVGSVNYVQTDLSLNPGNSGGPLLNARGEIIGIVTQKVKGFEGLGFAITAEEAKQFSAHAIEEDQVEQQS